MPASPLSVRVGLGAALALALAAPAPATFAEPAAASDPAVGSGSWRTAGAPAAASTAACQHVGDYAIHTDAAAMTFSALGSPKRAAGGVAGAGAVDIRFTEGNGLAYGDEESTDGLPRPFTMTSSALRRAAQPGGAFGSSVAAAPINSADECSDLVIGMAGADGGRGAVVVVPGTSTGFRLSAARWLPTGSLSLRPGDALGTAVTAVSTDAGMLIAAGAPGRDLAGARDAGELVTWLIPAGGTEQAIPAPTEVATYMQGSGRMRGRSERGDRFGSVIAARDIKAAEVVTVGIPDEDIGRAADAGAVARLTFSSGKLTRSRLLRAGSGLPGKPHAGDRLGAAVTTWHGLMLGGGTNDLSAVGVPGRNADGRKDSGAVHVRNLRTGKWSVVTQNTRGVPGRSEAGDAFGSSLVSAVIPGQNLSLAVGAPGEDAAAGRDAGAVTFINEPGVPARRVGGLAAGDELGARLMILSNTNHEEDRQDVLLAGAPGADVPNHTDAGAYVMVTQGGVRTSLLAGCGVRTAERYGA